MEVYNDCACVDYIQNRVIIFIFLQSIVVVFSNYIKHYQLLMPLGKKQRSACVRPNVSCLLFCVVEKIEWWKKKFILTKKKMFLIQVDGHENSNSIGGFWIFYYMHHGPQIFLMKFVKAITKGEK